MAITATIVCVPLGGMLAGVFANFVLPAFGWRGLFWIGGLIPLALAVALFLKLPEPPRFLAHHHARWPELVGLLGRMSRPVPAGSAFIDSREEEVGEDAGVRTLFQQGRARDTFALWVACFACLLAVYSAFSWLPTMLANEGLSASVAGAGRVDRLQPWRRVWRLALRGGDYPVRVSLAGGPVQRGRRTQCVPADRG